MISIILMNLILIVITLLLIIADKFLVSYGKCKISIVQENEKKEFVVQGGDYLLKYLSENKVDIRASCGGKATCGYCKVRVKSGGGEILPTEEIFIDREEKLENMRLACQVKVKNDIEIYIPDFLTTVKKIVKNQTFNPNIRWNFVKTFQSYEIPRKIIKKIPGKDKIKISEIIEKYKNQKGAVIPILEEINNNFNYLPEPVINYVSEELNIPLSIIYRIATFYNAFSFKPRGKNIITVCLGTACHVKGGMKIIETFQKELGIKPGETTKDMNFSLQTARCIGCCGLSPVLTINNEVFGKVIPTQIPKIIKKYKNIKT